MRATSQSIRLTKHEPRSTAKVASSTPIGPHRTPTIIGAAARGHSVLRDHPNQLSLTYHILDASFSSFHTQLHGKARAPFRSIDSYCRSNYCISYICAMLSHVCNFHHWTCRLGRTSVHQAKQLENVRSPHSVCAPYVCKRPKPGSTQGPGSTRPPAQPDWSISATSHLLL